MSRSKYGNVRTIAGDVVFDSKREADRYSELAILEKLGDITDLELQPNFDCVVAGKKVCRYVADFRYVQNGQTVIEDANGVRTAVYRLKKKLVEALYGLKIVEV